MSMIRFICDPSTTTVFSPGVSRPPSVAVPPVRATRFTPCSSAYARTWATSSVLCTNTTAAGIGMVYTSKIFCNLRKLSMLLSRKVRSSVTTRSAPTIFCRRSTMVSRVRGIGFVLFWRSVEGRIRALEERVCVAADVVIHAVADALVDRRAVEIRSERFALARHCPGRGVEVGMHTGANGRADCGAETGAAAAYVACGRHTEHVGQHSHEQAAAGSTTRDDDVIERDPELGAHCVGVVLHGQRDRFENRSIDVAPRVPGVEAQHQPFAERLVGRCQPVENGHQALAACGDLGGFALDVLLASQPQRLCPRSHLVTEHLQEPCDRPHSAAHTVALVDIALRDGREVGPKVGRTLVVDITVHH